MDNVMVVNETPRRTSKSFGINNIKIENFKIPEAKEFTNFTIKTEIDVKKETQKFEPEFSIGNALVEQLNNGNCNLTFTLNKEVKEPIVIEFNLDEEQDVLVDNIFIEAEENSRANIILKYTTENENIRAYHNGVCNIKAKANSNITVTVLNLLNKILFHHLFCLF